MQTIQSDLLLIQKRSKGEVLPGQCLEEVLTALNSGNIPSAWLSQSFPSCTRVLQWMKDLSIRMQRVSSYVNERAAVYNLSSFLRPDRFFEAVETGICQETLQGSQQHCFGGTGKALDNILTQYILNFYMFANCKKKLSF